MAEVKLTVDSTQVAVWAERFSAATDGLLDLLQNRPAGDPLRKCAHGFAEFVVALNEAGLLVDATPGAGAVAVRLEPTEAGLRLVAFIEALTAQPLDGG